MIKNILAAAAIAVIMGAGSTVYGADRGVRITTDRKHYESDQDVSAMTVTIANNSGETIYLADLSFEQVQLRKKFAWVPLENPMRGIRGYIAMTLAPDESNQRQLQHFFLPDREDVRGRRVYRLAVTVYSGCPGEGVDRYPDSCAGGRVVYSNTFTVKKDK